MLTHLLKERGASIPWVCKAAAVKLRAPVQDLDENSPLTSMAKHLNASLQQGCSHMATPWEILTWNRSDSALIYAIINPV